jgi:hypothetical protein
MRRFVVRRWRRPTRGKAARHATDDRVIPPGDMIQARSEHSGRGSPAEYPWEFTVARSPSSKTIDSTGRNTQLLPRRAPDIDVFDMRGGVLGQRALIRREGEVFEMHEGPQGQCALVRQDAKTKESHIMCKALNELVWPDFDDDI